MQYFTFLCHRFLPTLSCLQRRPLAARFISQGPNILLGITVPCLKEKNGMFSFLPFLIALICREEARYDQHEQHRTRRSPKIFQPIGVKHWRSFSQLEWNVKCVSKIWLTASYMQKCISNGHMIRYQGYASIMDTTSYAVLRAADLDWIVRQGYSSGGYILEKKHLKPTWNHEKPTWNHEKPSKTNPEPWKTILKQPGTMKNLPRTMKNHENRPGTIKNRPRTMKNQPGTMKNH